ncbi:hypothetical protein FA15DRAFT_708635 [Coprinopsis marcescibilis]|uniref:Uncharacterized protein n=1 Tax=Coprinopsis marcescibilis TaxID=230819 RepID=A0A5C3KIH3_COPMA|nr:hypothetical protein FA15DRAFT_708635 [Coprinopsis marcescibilis]
MNPVYGSTGEAWIPHRGAPPWTAPKRGRSPSDAHNTNSNESLWVKRARLDPADASRAFASDSNDFQNWEERDPPQMFQQAHNFTMQGDSTFSDVQGHVDATYLATMRSSLSSTTAEPQYQHCIPSHSLAIGGQSYKDPHALTTIEEWQTGPAYSSRAALLRRPSDLPVVASSAHRTGSSSNSGGCVPKAVNPVSRPSTSSFQGASNLEFSGTTTFINAHTVVVPNVSTRDIALVAEALSSNNFRNFLADHLRKRVGKTGRWVLSEANFGSGGRHLAESYGGLACVSGAGRTILASIIVEYLMELAKSNKRICVAFAYTPTP